MTEATPSEKTGAPGAGLLREMDLEKIERGVRLILEGVGEDVERQGLRDTPQRVAQMYQEVLAGTHVDLSGIVEPMASDEHQELVLVKNISFHSICEHHLTPFFGKAHVAYIPSRHGKITGISKLARLVKVAAARLQLQERLATTVADTLVAALEPNGVLVLIQAEHLCMTMRGVRAEGTQIVTSAVRGVFRNNASTRAEVLALIDSSSS